MNIDYKAIHNSAMNIAEEAFLQRRLGNHDIAKDLFKKSSMQEALAASEFPPTEGSEPTRSILLRSAASLAFNSGDFELSERLICSGLSGFPPAEIREELKNLFEDINFLRHLKANGQVLGEDQWLMSMAGDAVSFGTTAAEIFLTKVEHVSSLFYRTVERLLKIPYRIAGSIDPKLKKSFGLYIRAMAPASFSVTFQVGAPDPQLFLPGMESECPLKPKEVVNEIFSCFRLFENDELDTLRGNIGNSDYYENFVGIAKQLSPDGKNISLVGFSAIQDGVEKPVALRRIRKGKQKVFGKGDVKESTVKNPQFNLSGILRHANSPSKGKFGLVKLIDHENGSAYSIKVPIAIMKDVVKPYYEEKVQILGSIIDEKYVLEDIFPV